MKQTQIREVYQGQVLRVRALSWHPRKDDTHKSVRPGLKGQETKRIECFWGCDWGSVG